MKKLFSLLTLALLTMSAWAATYTHTFASGELKQSAGTVTLSGIDWTQTAASYIGWDSNNGKGVQIGSSKSPTTNFSLSTNAFTTAISSITVNASIASGGDAKMTVSVGGQQWGDETALVLESNDYTFTGNASGEVVISFSASTKGYYIKSITIEYEGPDQPPVVTVAAPTLPATQNFNDSFTVTITNNEEGATLSYSTDGLTWQNYNAPFTITETTTVYAKAVKGEIESEVVSAKYTKNAAAPEGVIAFNGNDFDAVTDSEWTISKDGVTIHCSKGSITSTDFRLFKSSTTTFSADKAIEKIVFICAANGTTKWGPGCFAAQEGYTYEADGPNGTWEGSANSVSFVAESNQVRPNQILVYLGEAPAIEVAAPTFDPEGKNFDESITVTINAEEGANIKYSTDEKVTWNDYTTPLNITETTTVYAKAVKGEKESQVVSATYTKNEPAEVTMTLDEVNNTLGANAEFTYGGNAVVTAQQGAYLWVRDATGYGLIYGKINGVDTLKFNNGQVLNPNWNATKTVYNGLTEYKDAMNVSASVNTDTELAAPQEITELSADLINAYVVVKNITSFTVNNRNVTANLSDGSTMVMYNQFNTVITNIPTEEGNYTVYGAVGRYAKDQTDQIQLYILQIDGAVTPPEPEAVDVYNFNEAYALTSGTKINMFNDVVVTYQKGNRLWVRDTEGTSGLIYGALDATFNNGDVLSDDWTATYQLFNDLTPEFTNPEGIEASGETREAAPYERTAITTGNVNEYIIMKGLTLLPDADNAKRFYNATDSLVIFNSFNVEIPEVVEGKTYDVTGIVTIYYGEAQVYITEMTEVAAAGLRGDVNDDTFVNISDVTALIDLLLGGGTITNPAADCNQDSNVNISDVTALIDFLLSGNWPANE